MKKSTLKRIILTIYLAGVLVSVAVPFHESFAQATGACSTADSTGNTIMPKSACDTLGGVWIAATITPNTAPTTTTSGGYQLLTPLPCDSTTPGCVNGSLTSFDPSQKNSLSTYLNIVIKILIGLAAVLAMIMIVMGGIQYMTSDFVSSKEEGKHRITNAIIGLLIALVAYIILFTINPNLLKTIDPSDQSQFANTTITADYSGDLEGAGTYTPISQNVSPASLAALRAMGIVCPGSGGISALPQIAESFIGHVTYDNNLRGTIDATIPTVYLDCSSYVAQVYACAGLSNPGSNTSNDFASQTPVPRNADGSVNTSALQVGDLVGWTAADFGTAMGHVLMYIGNGQFINSVGAKVNGVHSVNGSVQITSSIMKQITWINPAP